MSCALSCESGTCNDVVAVAAGHANSCAVRGNGELYCWGDNARGQLGTGTVESSLAPVKVALDRKATAVALSHGSTSATACAILDDRTVRCWGANDEFQLGAGPDQADQETKPVAPIGLVDVVELALGGGHGCALRADGTMLCWGSNASGQLGNETGGAPRDKPAPVEVNGEKVVAISAGTAHTCAITHSAKVHCWGLNSDGQAGSGPKLTPKPTMVTEGASALGAGFAHSCAVVGPSRFVECWGSNALGQLGTGGAASAKPVVVGVSGVARLALGVGISVAIVGPDRGLVTWGSDALPTNGPLLDSPVPTETGLHGVLAASVGTGHVCALTIAGELLCWGANAAGQLGDGTTQDSGAPVAVWSPQ